MTDDEDDLVEARRNGVMDGVVHQNFAVGTDSGQLLDAAAVARADTGSHDNQSCFHY